MANKRKTTTGIIAGVTAVALLLGGTFAWTSISQQAKNETAGVVNVGGRLHDDFNGTNKDIYVENFTDPLDGGQPIYARIKLTEYMEVGQDAGGFGVDVDGDGKTEVVPVVENTDINDVSTWTAHVPAESCAICATEGTCKIHDHWKWIMGGEEGDGSTIFMPTFNKDKDSLAADINGTYHGTDNTDKVYYDDYVVYTTDANGLANVPQADIAAQVGEILSVDGTAYYDDDPTHDENDHDNNIGAWRTEPETHTAKKTATATVVTMDYWKNTLNSAPGNYWVYDTDGWAYWANPIMPGESTGLLLDGIEMFQNPGEKCYYSINVVGQFATVNDWEYFTDGGEPSEDAQNLLKIASDNVTTVTVTNNGATTLGTTVDEEAGITNTTTFTATAVKASDGTSAAAESEFTWAVYDADLNPVETSTITDNGNGTVTLTVGENEKSASLIIAARHTESGAVGLSAVAIDNPVVTYRLAVSSNDTGNTEDEYYTPYEDRGAVALDSSYTVTLTANDKPLTISEVGEVEIVASYNEYNETLNAFAGSADLQDDGTILLTIGNQDVEFGTSGSAWSYWKIIKLTVKDSEGTEYSRNLLISNDALSYSEFIYRHMDGSLATNIQQYYVVNDLTVGTMYTFEPSLHSQSHGTMSQYLDPVPFDDSWTVNAYVEDDEGNRTAATSVTIKDNTIIFAETGEYVIEAVKGEYETVTSRVTVSYPRLTVVATDPDWDGSFAKGESMTFKVEGDYTAADLLWENTQDGGAMVNISLESHDDGTATITHAAVGVCAVGTGNEIIKVSLVSDPNICGYVPITCE